jgi:electron transport complex protein RnfB
MADVYKRLATHLDNLPASFPATDSGVELRILKRLLTPEEAEAAMALIVARK